MTTPTTETPETLRALADEIKTAGRAGWGAHFGSLRARADELERERAMALRSATFSDVPEVAARARELERAGKGAAHTPGPLAVVHGGSDFYIESTATEDFIADLLECDNPGPNARLLAAAYTSYDAACGPRAIEAAESDLLADALAALRGMLNADPSDPMACVARAESVLARAPGGRPK